MKFTAIDRRVLGGWISLFGSILALFFVLFLTIEAIEREALWRTGAGEGLVRLARRAPLLLHYALAPAVLLATMVWGEILSRRNEVLAAWSVGISPARLFVGIGCATLGVLGPVTLGLSESAVPRALAKESPAEGVRLEWIHSVTANGGFLAVRSLEGDVAEGLWIARPRPDGAGIDVLLWAPRARWNGTAWDLDTGTVYTAPDRFAPAPIDTELPSSRALSDEVRLRGAGLATSLDPFAFPRLSLSDLVARARFLSGIPGSEPHAARVRLEIHRRFANALLPFALAFFAFVSALRAGRKMGTGGAIGRGVLLLAVGETLYRVTEGLGRYFSAHPTETLGFLAVPVGAWLLPLSWLVAGLALIRTR